MYRITLTKTAARAMEFLAQSQPAMAQRIGHAIDQLAGKPELGIPLRGELKGCWKYRVGSYRIIYQILRAQVVVVILDVGHRREVYR